MEDVPARGALARRPALALSVVVIVGALLYGRAIGFGYTHYDDYPLVVGLHDYLADARNLVATFFHDAFGQVAPVSRGLFYRPVLVATYVVDTVVFGGSAAVYHATNVALHLSASALVFVLLLRLGQPGAIALFLALLFCVHPSLVAVPAWLAGRNESLLAIFLVLTVLSLLALLRDTGLRWLAPFLLCLALALFSKETGAAAAAVLPLVVLFERRPEEGLLARRLLVVGAGALLVGVVWFAMRRLVLGGFPVRLSDMTVNGKMLVVYAGKALLPVGLSVYPHPADVSLVPGLVVLAGLAVAMFVARGRLWGRAGLGVAWFAVFLAPTLAGPAETTGLEYRLYVPLIGLSIFAGVLLPGLVERLPRPLALGLAGLVLALFAGTSFARLGDFADDTRFWASAVRTSPHAARAWHYRAVRSLANERHADAEEAARAIVALRPDRAPGYVLLGSALMRLERFGEAESALRRATEIDPRDAVAWQMLSQLQRQRGRPSAAAESERRAVESRRSR